MAFKNKEELRKGELTSMIDMIFLLLIFFLVTLAAGVKPEEDQKPGIPERQKERPAFENAIKDTSFSLKISIQRTDTLIEGDPGQKYKVYFLDSLYSNEDLIDQNLPKDIKALREKAKATKDRTLDEQADFLDQTYNPFILPSRDMFFQDTAKFNKAYLPVIGRIEKLLTDMRIRQEEHYKYTNQFRRIKVFLDMDNDVYYRLIVDLNNMYHRLNPNKMMGVRISDDNLFINVTYTGQD